MNSKNRALMKPLLALACGAGLWAATPALAELADRSKPMNIEADSMRHDDARKITSFSGRVVATKGTLILRADHVEVRQDAQGNQSTTATGAARDQAFMRQKREGLNEFIEGQANRIERDDKTLVTKLVGNAKMRRYVGATLADEVVGDTVVYNDKTETYSVLGGPSTTAGGAYSGPVPAGRVRALIVPVEQDAARSPLHAPAGAVATPPAAARSSTTLTSSPAIGVRP